MNVEKRYAIAFAERLAIDVDDSSANLFQSAHGNMSGHQWIRNTGEASALQVHVCSANLGQLDSQQRRIAFKIGFGNFTQCDGSVWFWNYSDDGHLCLT